MGDNVFLSQIKQEMPPVHANGATSFHAYSPGGIHLDPALLAALSALIDAQVHAPLSDLKEHMMLKHDETMKCFRDLDGRVELIRHDIKTLRDEQRQEFAALRQDFSKQFDLIQSKLLEFSSAIPRPVTASPTSPLQQQQQQPQRQQYLPPRTSEASASQPELVNNMLKRKRHPEDVRIEAENVSSPRSSGVMADWASLPQQLLVLIVGLVKKFKDFSAFGTVCKSWHVVASKEHFKALWLRETTPYLMFPINHGGNKRDLFSLAEGEIMASVRVRNLYKRKCYESLGWFLAVDKDGSMCLLDPFSSREIPLPHLKTLTNLNHVHPFKIIKKMVLSARPSDPSDPSDFMVAIIFRCLTGLAFWRPGSESLYRPGGFSETSAMFEDITYHAGNFYALDDYGVKSFNILKDYPKRGDYLAPFNLRDLPNETRGIDCKNIYIVKMPDSLLIVSRTVSYLRPCLYTTREFRVYKFHISSNSWREINNIGNMALFLGSENATTIVDASRFPAYIKANHLYFTDDGERNPFRSDGTPNKVTGQDMGIYNLENGRIDQFYHGEAFTSKVSHPTWILPFLW